MAQKLTVPVLFIVFNRLGTTKKVFAEIKKAKPKKIYIAADGPRSKEEKKETNAVRNYILKNIDWKCEVKKKFEKMGGVRYGILMMLYLTMFGFPIKMFLRWSFNLKYIVAIPEFFFNI
ncbi:MAG: hypothetical protein IIC74_04860 [Bacteroidetes bacterium]|nr:hypothetical protein [Bacteroidota bacterium]